MAKWLLRQYQVGKTMSTISHPFQAVAVSDDSGKKLVKQVTTTVRSSYQDIFTPDSKPKVVQPVWEQAQDSESLRELV